MGKHTHFPHKSSRIQNITENDNNENYKSSRSFHFHPRVLLVTALPISLPFSHCLFWEAPLSPLLSGSSFRLAAGKGRKGVVFSYVALIPAPFHVLSHWETVIQKKHRRLANIVMIGMLFPVK